MNSVTGRVRAYAGRFHYWKWAMYYRHQQEYEGGFTGVYNLAFFMMAGWIVIDAQQHQKQKRSKEYLKRREAIDTEMGKCWSEERELHSLAVGELEEAVFRVRKQESLPELADPVTSGRTSSAVLVPLPIESLAKFKDEASR